MMLDKVLRTYVHAYAAAVKEIDSSIYRGIPGLLLKNDSEEILQPGPEAGWIGETGNTRTALWTLFGTSS
jgi:hypothetical protein